MAARCSFPRFALVTASVSLTVVSALGAGPSAAAVSGKELKLTFEASDLGHNSGHAALEVRQVTHDGGMITTATGGNGSTAARFPVYQPDTPSQAVLTVVDTQGTDDLDPGTAVFRFGAQFALDADSQGSPTDDGNNLVQRGLYSAETQYKLQVDEEHPECRVKGRDGAVSVRSSRAVTPGTWYRATCTRDGSTVTLHVKRMTDHKRWKYSATGVTGSMQPQTSSLPMSIGGKVTSRSTLRANDADQFNGIVDNVFLDIS
jgi:hypothetical protein